MPRARYSRSLWMRNPITIVSVVVFAERFCVARIIIPARIMSSAASRGRQASGSGRAFCHRSVCKCRHVEPLPCSAEGRSGSCRGLVAGRSG